MTTYSVPFKLRQSTREGVETTVLSVDASGALSLSPVSAAVEIEALGTVKSGTSASNLGAMVLTQRIECAAGSKNAINLPANSEIIGITLVTETAMGSAAGHTVRIGTSADSDIVGSISVVDTTNYYAFDDVTVSAGGSSNLQNQTTIVADVTVAGSADTVWTGALHVVYRR